MKTHAIIPIFIPHLGCPNDCVFCNQKAITARTLPPSEEEMREKIDQYLKTISGRGIETVEIAFYGGSFTGIPLERQREYLTAAKTYKDRGLIQKIRLSTRPDYISEEILSHLKDYGVDIIELGVQSLDEEVLRRSNRGHGRKEVFAASALIQERGFELGLQLMTGLPGDTYEKSVRSAREAAEIGPAIARLYPTVILKDTELYAMYQSGEFQPFSLEESVAATKEMYRILTGAGVNVIRVGLKSTDLISENGETAGGYHPAFRQLVESELAREQLESQLIACLAGIGSGGSSGDGPGSGGSSGDGPGSVSFFSNSSSFSSLIGHKRSNRNYFEKKYPHVRFTFHVDPTLPDNTYTLRIPDPQSLNK